MGLVRSIFITVVFYLGIKTSMAASTIDNQFFFNQHSHIYQSIAERLQDSIGQQEGKPVLPGKDGVYGGPNFIGFRKHFSWTDFSVEWRRDLAPDLFHDSRYVVTDKITLRVEAYPLIKGLRDQNKLNITDKALAGFVGLSFEREIRLAHFSSTFEEGLIIDINSIPLILMGPDLRGKRTLAPGEVWNQNDRFVFNAHGLTNMPVNPYMAIAAGGSIQVSRIFSVEIWKSEEDQQLKLSFKKEKEISTLGILGLYAQFFKALKIKLFQVELQYSFEEQMIAHMSLSSGDQEALIASDFELREFIRGKFDNHHTLIPYQVALEVRKMEKLSSRIDFLLFHGEKNAETEMVEIIKDQKKTTYFGHQFFKSKNKQGIWSFLWGVVFDWAFQTTSQKVARVEEKRGDRIEYESAFNVIQNKDKYTISKDKENFSISFSHFWRLQKWKKIGKHKEKKRWGNRIHNFIPDSKVLQNGVKTGLVVPPLKLMVSQVVNPKGVIYFNQLKINDVYGLIKKVCQNKDRRRYFRFLSFFNRCKRGLKKNFKRYTKELSNSSHYKSDFRACRSRVKKSSFHLRFRLIRNCLYEKKRLERGSFEGKVPLWRFKSFVDQLAIELKNLDFLKAFFGANGLFIHNKLEAFNRYGHPILFYKKQGQFKGTGLIQRRLIEDNLQAQASINP